MFKFQTSPFTENRIIHFTNEGGNDRIPDSLADKIQSESDVESADGELKLPMDEGLKEINRAEEATRKMQRRIDSTKQKANERQSDRNIASEDKTFIRKIEEESEGTDGVKVLEAAANSLRPHEKEIFSAGLVGPPSIERQILGTALFKRVIGTKIGLRDFFYKKHNSPMARGMMDIALSIGCSSKFALRCWVRKAMQDAEGVESPDDLPESNRKNVDDVVRKTRMAMDAGERNAEHDFRDNMRHFVENAKKQGRIFLTEQEKNAIKEGKDPLIQDCIRDYLEQKEPSSLLEHMSKKDYCPVSITFDNKHNLLFRPKSGKNAAEFMNRVSKKIGGDRVKNVPVGWEIREASSEDMHQLCKMVEFSKFEDGSDEHAKKSEATDTQVVALNTRVQTAIDVVGASNSTSANDFLEGMEFQKEEEDVRFAIESFDTLRLYFDENGGGDTFTSNDPIFGNVEISRRENAALSSNKMSIGEAESLIEKLQNAQENSSVQRKIG
jgi:hypothetical protein